MFRKVKRGILDSDPQPQGSPSRQIDPNSTVIGAGVTIKGDVEGRGEILLQGRLEGNLEVEGRVAIGPGGVSNGQVHAHEVILDGTLEGEVEADRRLVITSSGVLNGALLSPRLVVEEGGRLQGMCRMKGDAREGSATPAVEVPVLPTFPQAAES